MRKLISLTLLALVLALVASTAAVMTIHPQPAFADPDGSGGGNKP